MVVADRCFVVRGVVVGADPISVVVAVVVEMELTGPISGWVKPRGGCLG